MAVLGVDQLFVDSGEWADLEVAFASVTTTALGVRGLSGGSGSGSSVGIDVGGLVVDAVHDADASNTGGVKIGEAVDDLVVDVPEVLEARREAWWQTRGVFAVGGLGLDVGAGGNVIGGDVTTVILGHVAILREVEAEGVVAYQGVVVSTDVVSVDGVEVVSRAKLDVEEALKGAQGAVVLEDVESRDVGHEEEVRSSRVGVDVDVDEEGGFSGAEGDGLWVQQSRDGGLSVVAIRKRAVEVVVLSDAGCWLDAGGSAWGGRRSG